MEKRFIRKLVLLFTLSTLIWCDQRENLPSFRKQNRENIERFSLIPFSKATSIDSIEVTAFIEIPFYTLQFIKMSGGFVASYEASIALNHKNGSQVGHKTWVDSIKVSDYESTKSTIRNRKHYINFSVSKKKYILIGELYDRDTRKKGVLEKKLNYSQYKKLPSLLEPVFALKLEGEWGFESGECPIVGHRIREIDKGVSVYISGFIKEGSYVINMGLESNIGKINLSPIISDVGKNSAFQHKFYIAPEHLQSLKVLIFVELSQNGKVVRKEKALTIYRPGVSNFVNDINQAIKQMKYILTNQELSEIKGKNRKEVEKLFFHFWKRRDTTPETEYNELMDEYFGRIAYTNEHFDTSWRPGWETDPGMIYILFGAPDEVQRTNPRGSSSSIYQIWHYYRINKQFVFKDQNGFGDYRLETPFIGATY